MYFLCHFITTHSCFILGLYVLFIYLFELATRFIGKRLTNMFIFSWTKAKILLYFRFLADTSMILHDHSLSALLSACFKCFVHLSRWNTHIRTWVTGTPSAVCKVRKHHPWSHRCRFKISSCDKVSSPLFPAGLFWGTESARKQRGHRVWLGIQPGQ